MKKRTIKAGDLFCGAGGSSTGLINACRDHGHQVDLVVVNHWNVAIDTHTANHPTVKHLCQKLHNIHPREAVPGGYLDILWASPECTHHSRARGGKPRCDQSRASAHIICDWLEDLHVENLIVENVTEFMEWGPLGADGQPLKSRKGELFHAWIAMIKALNYNVEYRILNCANYGDPTTRERFFLIARRGRKKITWPEPTHMPPGTAQQLFTTYEEWRTARNSVINWEKKGHSIFRRGEIGKGPLCDNTIRRIMAGLRKFNGPFLVHLRGTTISQIEASAKSIDAPLPALTAGGGHLAKVDPFILHTTHQGGDRVRTVDHPLPTITGAKRGEMALIELKPFLVPQFGEREGQEPRTHSVDKPLPAVTGHGAGALVQPVLRKAKKGKAQQATPLQPFIVPQFSGAPAKSVDEPIGSITTTSRGVGLCEPFIMQTDHTGSNGDCVRSVDKPLGTVVTKQNQAIVQPFLTKYYGTGASKSVDAPIDTITANDRFGLVEPKAKKKGGKVYLDILFRMLDPDELARGQGFPSGYKFTGTKEEQTKQIGNAVPVNTAKALCKAVLS